jgi:hypothetical protein
MGVLASGIFWGVEAKGYVENVRSVSTRGRRNALTGV